MNLLGPDGNPIVPERKGGTPVMPSGFQAVPVRIQMDVTIPVGPGGMIQGTGVRINISTAPEELQSVAMLASAQLLSHIAAKTSRLGYKATLREIIQGAKECKRREKAGAVAPSQMKEEPEDEIDAEELVEEEGGEDAD